MKQIGLAFAFALIGSAAQAGMCDDRTPPIPTGCPGSWGSTAGLIITSPPSAPQQPVYQPAPHPYDELPLYQLRLQRLLR